MNLTSPLWSVLGWTLVHSLWQGALVAGFVACALHLLRTHTAQSRYRMAGFGLVALLLAPAATFLWLSGSLLATKPEAVLAPSTGIQPAGPWMPLAGGIWVVGASIMGMRLALSWLWTQRLRWQAVSLPEPTWLLRVEALARQFGLRQKIQILCSQTAEVPMVLGAWKPVILIPAAAFTGLAPWALEAVITHELAHIFRYDYLINLAQSMVEAVLFYHPAAWWLSHQIRMERENACDDLAIAHLGDPIRYARALADLESLRQAHLPETQLALAATGGSLMHRIRRILLPPVQPSAAARTGLMAALAVTALGATAAMGYAEEKKIQEQKRIVLQEDGYRLEAKLRGEVTLDPKTEPGVALGPEASLDITVRESPQRKRITITKDAKGITRSFSINGEERPMDATTEVWVSQQMERLAKAEAKAKLGTDGTPKQIRIEIHERGDKGGKPRVYQFRSGSDSSSTRGSWLEGTPEGDLHLDLKHLAKEGESIQKQVEELHLNLDQELKDLPRIKVSAHGDASHEGEIRREKDGRTVRRIIIRKHGDPKEEAAFLKHEIERLQKRLQDLESPKPKAGVKPSK